MSLSFLVAILLAMTAVQDARAQEFAFEHVNVLPMDRQAVLGDQTVLVRNGRIVEMGPAAQTKVSAGAVKVDGRGKYLMPGMAEMHGHIPPPTAPAAFVNDVLFLYVANGITTVRGMLGHPNQLDLRSKTNSGETLGPTLYLAGPSFSGSTIQSSEQAEQRVRQQKTEGWDLLKIHPGLSREHYDAIARTARAVNIPFAGHVPADVGLLHALEMGQQTIDHLDGYIELFGGASGSIPEEKLTEVARQTKKSGAWVVPTMVLWETILGAHELDVLKSFPELKYIPGDQVEQWTKSYEARQANAQFDMARAKRTAENRRRLLQVLNAEGVKILFGTDAPQQFSVPGFSMHREAQAMVQAGMKPYDVLQSGTANVGEYYKAKDKFGTIATGFRADLILLEANPLDDLANLSRRAGVMVRGRWIPESEIQSKLAEIEGR